MKHHGKQWIEKGKICVLTTSPQNPNCKMLNICLQVVCMCFVSDPCKICGW